MSDEVTGDFAGASASGDDDAAVGEAAGSVARRLVAEFGDAAQSVALQRASKGLGVETSARWMAVAAAVGVLCRASLHMELALSMLDEVGEEAASLRLDHAIATLGIRPTRKDP